jgi:hypothetical protein
MTRPIIALYMGLVFASGAVLGVVGNRYYNAYDTEHRNKGNKGRRPSPDEFRHGYLNFMQKRLELSTDQVQKLDLILDDTRAQMDDVMRRTFPEQQAIYKAQDEKIRGMLNDKQLQGYDQVIKEREERNKSKRKNGPFGPGF